MPPPGFPQRVTTSGGTLNPAYPTPPYAKFTTYRTDLNDMLSMPSMANAHAAFLRGKGWHIVPNAQRGFAPGTTDYGGGMVAGGTPAAHAAAAAAAAAGAAGAGARSGAGPAPATAPARPLTMAERAAQIAGLSIDPQIASLQRADASTALAWQDAMNTARGFDYIPQIQSAYQQAADSIAGYSQGLTGNLRDTQVAAAQDAANRVRQLGLPADASTVPTQAGDIANTNYYLGGVLPAADLATQAAQSVTGTATRQKAEEAALADQASAAHFKTLQDIADAEAKRPGLIADTLQNLQTQDLNERKFQADLAQTKAQTAATLATSKINQQNALATQKLNLSRFAWQKAMDMKNAGRQDEAMRLQAGALMLSQAKTGQQLALAMTNMTGQLYTVDKKGNVVPTGTAAPGSTAAKNIATQAAANADRQVKVQIANAANAARQYAADTAAGTRVQVANINAAARKAAARVSANAKKNAPPSPKDKLAIFKGADASGSGIVKARLSRIHSLMGAAWNKQGYQESDDAYKARIDQATETFKNRLTEHRDEIVAAVNNEISNKLTLLGYTPEQIDAYADSIVSGFIPLNPSPTWAPPGARGPK